MSEKILIIDHEQPASERLLTLLLGHGYLAQQSSTGSDGLRSAYMQQPDLVLLEAHLPDMDGCELCRRLRDLSDMPIIFISAVGDARDIVFAFEAGADDYVRKPFDDDELLARIRTRLRRSPRQRSSEELIFNNGELRINFISREVLVRSQPAHLTPKEFSLLAALARNAGRVVSRQELAIQAWGERYSDATDSLKLYVHYLRRKLERDPLQPEYILTSRGIGYRFAKR